MKLTAKNLLILAYSHVVSMTTDSDLADHIKDFLQMDGYEMHECKKKLEKKS